MEEDLPEYTSMDQLLEDMRRDLQLKDQPTVFDYTSMHRELSADEESTKKPLLQSIPKHNRFGHPSAVVITETQEWYMLKDHIGDSYVGRRIPVYISAYCQSDTQEYHETLSQNKELFFSLKLVDSEDEESAETYELFRQETERNSRIPDHENIMGIKKRFLFGKFFCVVFPSMSLDSLRAIMASYFPDGLPEECIVIALKETLQALSFIHENSQVHGGINAGHIYMNWKGEIKIGFSATVYEDEKSLNLRPHPSVMPMITVCNWAAAPEVYDSQTHVHTQKSDIWMIGITALELALGNRFKILSRVALEIIVRRMNENRRFPQQVQGAMSYDDRKPKETRQFSNELQEMVTKCLSVEAHRRPTAAELLESSVFRNSERVLYFHELVWENLRKRKY